MIGVEYGEGHDHDSQEIHDRFPASLQEAAPKKHPKLGLFQMIV
ncbi:MAG: hypothetical protein AAF490_28225 [Chloroflexota bacterium]